jgi:hypothetical protein
MLVATLIFVFGSRFYRHVRSDRNVVLDTGRALYIGLSHKLSCKQDAVRYAHWLDPAKKRFGEGFILDVRAVLSVFVIFSPTVFFWALYDQQGSRWTLQAQQMETFSMGPLGRFRPDQMQALNSVLVLLFIPLFERVLYPLLRKCHVPLAPLRRMTYGMILCGVAFAVAGLVQVRIDTAKPEMGAPAGQVSLRVLNAAPWPATLSGVDAQGQPWNVTVAAAENTGAGAVDPTLAIAPTFTRDLVQSGGLVTVNIPSGAAAGAQANITIVYKSGRRYSVAVYPTADGTNVGVASSWDDNLRDLEAASADDVVEQTEDLGRIRVFNGLGDAALDVSTDGEMRVGGLAPGNASNYERIAYPSGRRTLIFGAVQLGNTSRPLYNVTDLSVSLRDGADYTAIVFPILPAPTDPSAPRAHAAYVRDVAGNSVSIAWQVPQYVVITASEILFSVTGMEFAFQEAPSSMKAVAQSLWLLTTTVGSLIVIIVAESRIFDEQRDEFFFFAGAMGVVCLVFAYMAYHYRYLADRQGPVEDTVHMDATQPLIDEDVAGSRNGAAAKDYGSSPRDSGAASPVYLTAGLDEESAFA